MDVELRESLDELGVELPPIRTVLLVDDEPENLFVLEALLDEDWDVITADGGDEALEVLEGGATVDLIISDQRMPGMTGVELLTRVAARWPDTIRMVLTGYTDVDPMVRAINDGAIYRFLLKPWSPDEMRAAVREAIDVRTTRLALETVIRKRKKRNEELSATLDELERTERQILAADRLSTLGRLTAGIAHDIRNQAHVMLLLVDSVDLEGADPATRAAAELARDSLADLVELVQDVNTFAGAHNKALHRIPTELRPLLDETVALFALEAGGQGRPIEVEVDGSLSPVPVSVQCVRQALIALLRNGATASPPGSPLTLRARTLSDEHVAIEVIDRGRGMTPEELSRAPQPFYSGFSPQGLGLGLEIARLITEAHGGAVQLESTMGRGTTARLTLARAAAPLCHPEEESTRDR